MSTPAPKPRRYWLPALLGSAAPSLLVLIFGLPFLGTEGGRLALLGAWFALPVSLLAAWVLGLFARGQTLDTIKGMVIGSMLRLAGIVAFCLALRGLAVGGAAFAVIAMASCVIAGLLIDAVIMAKVLEQEQEG